MLRDSCDAMGNESSKVSRVVRWLVFATVFLVSALYVAKGLKRGWVPHDEGVLGQSAERVLQGELPHRDYPEIYTGGLAYLNAMSFRLFGTNLASMRYMLFLFFLLWVPSFYYLARRFVSVPMAGAVTLLAVAWSIPNYSAAMPSWYNLFFATFGLAALLRYIEVQCRRWVLIAGLCGGVSCLFKISGLYFIAGAMLFILFRELVVSRKGIASRRETVLYRIFLTVSVFLYEALVFWLLRRVANAATLPYFWTPNLAIGIAILWVEFNCVEDRSERFLFLCRELALFTVGILLPVAAFLIRYLLSGSLLQLFRGISGSVGSHIEYVTSKPSVMKLVVGIAVNLLLTAVVFLPRPRITKRFGILFFAGMPVILILARTQPYVDRAIWGMMWAFLPLVVVIGAVLVACWSTRDSIDVVTRQKLFLLLSVCASTNLIQFPFTIPIYYCYVAPFLFLSASALFSCLQAPPKWSLFGALCFCVLYIVLIVTPGFIVNMAQQYLPNRQIATLKGHRAGGLRVDPWYAQTYEQLNAIVKEHSGGQFIYAAPDCPEVYFLNGLRDPTQILFHLDSDHSRRTNQIMEAIRDHNVKLIVLNLDPQFSEPVPSDLRAALEREFPNRDAAGPFEVRWRP